MRRMEFSSVRNARSLTMADPQLVAYAFFCFIRAALPFRSRRKYSFARRTRAERVTSIVSMIGECSGKMRSTPCPNDTFRTVNVRAGAAPVHADDHALEHLDAFLVALAHLHVYADGITRLHRRALHHLAALDGLYRSHHRLSFYN